jgi:prolyl-tRNA synthetase
VGEDTLLICDSCGYSANRQIALMQKPAPPQVEPKPVEEVHTPNVTTIAGLANYLQIPEAETSKAIFMVAEMNSGTNGETREQFVFAVVRGDMDVNETKLSNLLKARRLRPATVEEIRAIKAEPGYGSPVGIERRNVVVVVDDLVARTPNLVAGANREGYHLRNVNYGRDYSAEMVSDIVAVADGDSCPKCSAPLRSVRGVEVGNIFKLGTKYSVAMGATYLDEAGNARPIVMGCYGIGPGRLMACVIEHLNDEQGIKWPITIAPYQVLLVSLANEKTPEVAAAADRYYMALREAGIDVLYDDRDERAGVKFNDADLLGIPIRLTLGGKGLQNGSMEMKLRRNGEGSNLPLDNLVAAVRALIDEEVTRIHATLAVETLE